MNIKELNEKLTNLLVEDVDSENALADAKAVKRVYVKAYEALEELQDQLLEGIAPGSDKLDPETDKFYNAISDMINEIHSRSLAFEV